MIPSLRQRNLFLPGFLFPISLLSVLLSMGVFGLSILNYGLLSRWYNAAASVMTIIFHCMVFFLSWRHRRCVEPTDMVPVSPMSFPSSSGKTPSAEQSTNTALPIKLQLSTPEFSTNEEQQPRRPPRQFHIVHMMATILSLSFVTIIYIIALGIMMDITRRGSIRSTLPAERAPGMTFPWNIKVQIAQTALVGTECVLLSVILAISIVGRSRIAVEQDEHRQEIEYGLSSPDSDSIPEKSRYLV